MTAKPLIALLQFFHDLLEIGIGVFRRLHEDDEGEFHDVHAVPRCLPRHKLATPGVKDP